MILLIDVCCEPLHREEFVVPIEQIIQSAGFSSIVCHYSSLTPALIAAASHIIICGTSLSDTAYLEHAFVFDFLRDPDFRTPVLGICAGMQLLSLVFSDTHTSQSMYPFLYIGMARESFEETFLSLCGTVSVYHLHTLGCQFPDDFICCSTHDTQPIAVKHHTKPLYGVLFHPEVRNEELITQFLCESI